jgi:hypothetical protein
MDAEKYAKHAKPGPRTERKKGGLKRKKDDESDQQKSLERTEVGRKKEGTSGVQSSTQKPAVTTCSRRRFGKT